MAKTLNQFLEGYLKVKNPDEQKFVDKHVVAKHSDRNGNDDEVFKGSKVKMADRRKDRHGYNPGEDEKVYEELKGNQHKIDANKNGKVDAHDFKLLRKKKKVNEASYKDGDTRMGSVGPITTDAERAERAKKYREKMMKKEEVEELDELDTSTLKSYRTKARAQGNAIIDKMKMGGGDWSKDQKDTKTLRKRATGANMSGKQLVKRGESLKTEEVEELDELSKTTLATYAVKAKNQMGRDEARAGYQRGIRTMDGKGQGEMERAHDKRAEKRSKGIDTALNKLAKEEAEQIDEVNVNQIKKDLDSGMSHDAVIGKHANKRTTNTDAIRKVIKQHAWDKRMKKEEVELDEKLTAKTPMGTYIKDFQKSDAPQFKGKSQEKRRVMAIAAKLTAERGGKPLRKEEKLVNLLGDLTESHRRTMLSVFDKLNEDNQKKFLEACETPEGVEYMLDFAISHRGE